MSGCLGAFAGCTGAAVVLDERSEIRPGKFSSDKGQSLVNTIVAREDVVMAVSEYTESEIVSIGDIDFTIMQE